MIAAKFFIDTSYVVGLYNEGDSSHQKCIEAFNMCGDDAEYFITDVVLMEIGNAFSSVQDREKGAKIVRKFMNADDITVIKLKDEYFDKALKLYEKRPDKEWGLVDCFSFVVMKEFKLKAALTMDRHFRQAGFHILPF